MLHHLLALAGESEPGFASETIRWQVELSPKGKLLGVLPLGDGKRGEVHNKVPKMHNMNAGGRSHFLVETAQTVSLYFKKDEDDKKKQAAREKHRFFVKLTDEASQQASVLKGISDFLNDKDRLRDLKDRFAELGAKPSEWIKFTVGGKDPLLDETVASWWKQWRIEDLRTSRGEASERGAMIDLLTGQCVSPADTHPKVEGLMGVGGLPTKDVVAGFDKDAFTSYGLKQSRNAAMSEATARGCVDALNSLIRESGTRLADTLVVHWFKEQLKNDQDDPLSWLSGRASAEADAASAQLRAKQLLKSIRTGERSDLAKNRYYAIALSGAAGRVMMRDWMEGAFETLVTNVDAWFGDLSIVARDGDGLAREPKFMAVAGALVRELDDLHADIVAPLWRAAVNRLPIPHRLLAQAVLRARVDVIKDNPANHARMGLMKAYFVRDQQGGNKTMTAYLNPDHPDPAYHCGRLLAVLSGLQRSALGDVGAGVVQRYYTAASQTPALIIGRLMSNAKNHLGKLEGGLAYWYENKIAEVMSRIRDSAPRTLDLEHQSLFALGYYQQLAADRAGRPNANKED
jgi:CRISPR-associated protein Csd1